MPADDLVSLDATELLLGYATGALDPREVCEAVLARVEEVGPRINAFSVVEADLARAAAADSAGRWATGQPSGVLDGIPLTLKENVATAGTSRPSGTAACADAPVDTVDGPVAMLTGRAGAVRVGKTVMPDYGMLSSGVSSLHGVTRSPWNPEWTVGGSSSGSSAATAARLGPIHVGSDIGGSIRLPAGWVGAASLKPTYGIVPVDPPYFGRTAGPLARSVDDLALAMEVLARPDPLRRDFTQPPSTAAWADARVGEPSEADVAGLRVAIHVAAGAGMPTDPEVAAVVTQVGETFARAGARVETIEPFVTPEQLHLFDVFLRARSWGDLQRLAPRARAAVLPYIEAWAAGAAELTGTDVMDAFHGTQAIRATTVAATEAYDVVLSPVAPVAAFPAHHHGPTNDPATGLDHIAYTAPYNLSEQPAATVNAGFTADGRPVGVQLAGRRHDDVRLLRATRWYEHARPEAARPVWPA